MKVLIFITGYRHLEEYNYFSKFLNMLQLKNIANIFIYCNNPHISSEIVKYYQQFQQTNKHLFITSLNNGHRTGGVEAVSQAIDMGIFQEYDYVIHVHPDVFITDDAYLTKVMLENLENDIVFFITKSDPNDPTFFSFDFFMFKPKLLKTNIFSEGLYSFQECPEHYLHNMIMKNNIPYTLIQRYNNNTWYPRRVDDHLKMYHEHDLTKVQALLDEMTRG